MKPPTAGQNGGKIALTARYKTWKERKICAIRHDDRPLLRSRIKLGLDCLGHKVLVLPFLELQSKRTHTDTQCLSRLLAIAVELT